MKLIYKAILAVSAVSLLALVSCDKEDKNVYGEDFVAPAIETPSFAGKTLKVVMSEGAEDPVVTKDKSTDGNKSVVSVEFTDSGYAIVGESPIKPKSLVSGAVYSLYPYTFSADKYVIKGFAEVAVNGNNVSFSNCNTSVFLKEAYNVLATVSSISAPAGTDSKVFSSWKIHSVDLKVDGGDVKIDHLFDGKNASSLPAIAKYINGKKSNLVDESKVKGYVVNSITLSKDFTFVVDFTEADDYFGDFTLKGNNFSYVLSNTEGDFAFNAEAEGTLSVDAKTNLLVLTVNGKIKSEGVDYATKVVFKLQQITNVN